MPVKILTVILVGITLTFGTLAPEEDAVADTRVEIEAGPETAVETPPDTHQEPAFSAPVSKMAQLSPDATYLEMAHAFEEDYARAAKDAGVTPNHAGMQYTKNEWGAAFFEGYDKNDRYVSYKIDPPSTYYRIWYLGYPETDEWAIREIQLILMAADRQISASQAFTWANEVYESAGHLEWSAEHRDFPNGIQSSITRNAEGFMTFWIKY